MKPMAVTENDPRAQHAIDRYSELKQERDVHEGDWRSIARLIRPQRGGFGFETSTGRAYDKPLSSEPAVAHGNFAAGIYAGITNPARRWAGLTTPDEDLNKWPPFAEWLDRQTRKVHNSFSPSISSFYPASYQGYADVAAFGNLAGYDEMDMGRRQFIDVTLNLGEVVVALDFHGRVIEWVRKFQLTPNQAAGFFTKGALPAPVAERVEDPKRATDKNVYYHHVLRNEDFEAGRLGPRGRRWLSRYACEVDVTLVRERGYATMPCYYARWDVDSAQTYGVGPGFLALASARVHHQMESATIRGAQMAADPVRLAPDRNAVPLEGTWRPGGMIYGAMVNGTRQVGVEDFANRIGLTVEEKRAKIEEIKNAFFYSVMSLTGRTGLSDEENRVIEEARLRNWAPHADRVMQEYAAPKMERRYNLLMMAGQIDPVPEGTPADAGGLYIQYQSAAAEALKASEANAVRRYVGDLLPLMEIKPGLKHRLSEDDYAEILHEANPTLPQRLLRTREQANELAMAEQRQAEMAGLAEMAKSGGAGLNDMAQAQAIAQQGGGQ